MYESLKIILGIILIPFFVNSLNDYFQLGKYNSTLFGLLFFLIYLEIDQKNKLKRISKFCLSVDKLTPEFFGIENYNSKYIHREGDNEIDELISKKQNVLITGKPRIGNTRAAYEAIKKQKNYVVIRPKSSINTQELENIYSFCEGKNVILFLDNITEKYNDSFINDIIDKLGGDKLIIVATSHGRRGKELEDLVLDIDLSQVELCEITTQEGKEIAKDLGLTWHNVQFDGTPGSITLNLGGMRKKYRNERRMGDSKNVLFVLKLLKAGGINVFRKNIVKMLWKTIFEGEDLNSKKWESLIKILEQESFITTDKRYIYIYPQYLDYCVSDQYDLPPGKWTQRRVGGSIGAGS